MKRSSQYAAIGAVSGGLLGFWISSRMKAKAYKKALALVGGMAVGGTAGYGIGKAADAFGSRALAGNTDGVGYSEPTVLKCLMGAVARKMSG